MDLYLHASAHSGWTAQSASEDLGFRMADIEKAQAELRALHLLTPIHAQDRRLVANAPDVALAEVIAADERQIQDLRASVARHRRELMALLPAFRKARDNAMATPEVETIEDPETVMTLLMDMGRHVTQEVLIVQPGSSSTVERYEQSNAKDRSLLEQGVARRTLYDDRRRDHMPTQRSIAELEPLGAQFRTLPIIPFRMFVFDRNVALVARRRDPSDRAALVLRSPDIVTALVAVFDAAWEFATPFRALPDDEALDEEGPCAVQRAILTGLSMGLTDEALANRMGVSVRTCRRHIAALFGLLGAESRFQAAVLAVGRGWIPAPSAARLARARTPGSPPARGPVNRAT